MVMFRWLKLLAIFVLFFLFLKIYHCVQCSMMLFQFLTCLYFSWEKLHDVIKYQYPKGPSTPVEEVSSPKTT